ncbi:MAG: NAD(P)H-dependent oxidoreductase [Pseudoxanthomonas sp.]
MNILHVDSSIMGEQSVSRKLTAAVVERLLALTPGARVTYRDVAREPLPQVYGALFAVSAGADAPQRDSELYEDAAVVTMALDEVLAADVIVIGAPMYNFSIPSQLKSWLDALAVRGKTFRYDANGAQGLLGDKRVIVASSRGNVYSAGTPYAAADHHESYLRSFFGFLGVTQIEIVRAEGLMISPERGQAAVAAALEHAGQLKAA